MRLCRCAEEGGCGLEGSDRFLTAAGALVNAADFEECLADDWCWSVARLAYGVFELDEGRAIVASRLEHAAVAIASDRVAIVQRQRAHDRRRCGGRVLALELAPAIEREAKCLSVARIRRLAPVFRRVPLDVQGVDDRPVGHRQLVGG